MNKKRICKLLFFLLALFLFIGIRNESAAAAKGGSYKILYRKFLQKKTNEKIDGNYVKRFYLLNVDKKGVPELFYTNGSHGAAGNGVIEVYTIKKQKVRKIGQFTHSMGERPYIHYNKKTSSVFGKAPWLAYGYFDRYNYQGGKWKSVYNCGYGINRNEMQYYTQGRIVSKTAYKNFEKKHFKSLKWKKYKMKELTPKNLKTI